MAAQHASRRPVLRLVETFARDSIWFCGRCGERFIEHSSTPMGRVCPTCALGLLLQTYEDAAPMRGDAFVIVDSSLAVQAVSEQAEAALGISEQHAVNRHVSELLIPGESEPHEQLSLVAAITRAAGGDPSRNRVAVRPSNTFGVRMLARIAACGPPLAALLVLGAPAA